MVVEFILTHKWVFLFYTTLFLVIFSLRRYIDWQGFLVGLYRTKVGIRLMDRWGKKYRGLIQVLGYIGVGIGFIGMGFITFMLMKGVWNLFFVPDAPPVVSPVIPGVKIPGTELTVPLITGWLALFIVIVIHEFSHGVVARAYDVKVKSSGLLIFGPIAGAFVEPDEKELAKKEPIATYSMTAAGPASNVITAFLFFLVATFVVSPIVMAITAPGGVEITALTAGYPGELAGLEKGMVITAIDGVPVLDNAALNAKLDGHVAGDVVTLTVKDGEDTSLYAITLAEHPSEPGEGYIGIVPIGVRDPQGDFATAAVPVLRWLFEFLTWVFLLSLGIGLANLLPLGPVDGGRMLQAAARQIVPNQKRADMIWKRISVVVLVVIVGLLLHAMVQWFV